MFLNVRQNDSGGQRR